MSPSLCHQRWHKCHGAVWCAVRLWSSCQLGHYTHRHTYYTHTQTLQAHTRTHSRTHAHPHMHTSSWRTAPLIKDLSCLVVSCPHHSHIDKNPVYIDPVLGDKMSDVEEGWWHRRSLTCCLWLCFPSSTDPPLLSLWWEAVYRSRKLKVFKCVCVCVSKCA